MHHVVVKVLILVLSAGWPTPPAQEPWCSICPAGWASNTVDAKECSMCMPGYYAENPDSPACLPCPGGTYSSSWGSSQCSHCITGTYSPSEVQNIPSQSVQPHACQTAQLHRETHCICSPISHTKEIVFRMHARRVVRQLCFDG